MAPGFVGSGCCVEAGPRGEEAATWLGSGSGFGFGLGLGLGVGVGLGLGLGLG